MIDAFSPFLALRYLLTRRINLLAIGGVMFAVWAIILVDSVFTGFVTQIRTDVRASACDLLLSNLPHETSYRRLLPALQDDDVAATAPRLRHFGMLQPKVGRKQRSDRGSNLLDFESRTENGYALLLGIDPVREEAIGGLRPWVQRGPQELDDRYPGHGSFVRSPVLDEPDAERKASLLLPDADEWRARERAGLPRPKSAKLYESIWPGVLFGWRRIESMRYEPDIADPFDLVCATFQGPDGAATVTTPTLRVAYAGTFATGARTFDEATVLLPIRTLRTLLGHDPSDPGSKDIVSDVAIRLRADLPAGARAACKQRLQQRVQALLGPGAAPCACYDWEEQNVVFLSAVAHEQGMMQFVLFVVMLVAAFVIYATLHMMVTQKVRDIGILAALGGSPRSIGGVFLFGGLAVALFGTALGVGIGLLSAVYLNAANDWLFAHTGLELFPRTLFDLKEVPCDLQPSWIAIVAIGAIVLSLVVAYLPSRQAARLHPVAALAHE